MKLTALLLILCVVTISAQLDKLCKENQEFSLCGCDLNCSEDRTCEKPKCKPGCFCKEGYGRLNIFGKCMECPKEETTTTSTTTTTTEKTTTTTKKPVYTKPTKDYDRPGHRPGYVGGHGHGGRPGRPYRPERPGGHGGF